jgi:hypothetical protein
VLGIAGETAPPRGPEKQWRPSQGNAPSGVELSLRAPWLGQSRTQQVGGPSAAPHNRLASGRTRLPAELKHINKRRKRNQQGLPQ